MTRSVAAIAVIAAIMVAVAGCAGTAIPSGPGVVATSPPSVSPGSTVPATPHASIAAATPIPGELRYVWIGPARDIPALGGPQALSIIRIRDAKFDFIHGEHGQEALNSTVSVPEPGEVRFTSVKTTGGCHVGDEGVYEWTTTADGAGLTMTEATETCAPRAEAVVGDWVRAACKDFGCLGDLEAGTHLTGFFEPLGQPAGANGSWRMQYGQLSYTVPVGWANADDAPGFYNIVRADAYARPASDETAYPGISLIADVAVAAQDEACSAKVEPGVGKSAGEMAARIARIPGLEVGARTGVTIAGRSGTMVDLALKPGWNQSCAVGGGVPVIRENIDSAAGGDWRMTATGRWRLILLDVAPGRPMAILIDAFDEPSRFDDLVVRAMSIVTSFELHKPGQ